MFLHRNTSKVLFEGTIGENGGMQDGSLYDENGVRIGKYRNYVYEPEETSEDDIKRALHKLSKKSSFKFPRKKKMIL